MLAPWLAAGDLLVRDLVAVRDPAWTPSLLTGGSRVARDVPGEVLAALAGEAVGGALVVRVALLVAVAALGAGVGRLLAGQSRAAVVVGAVSAVWNPWTWSYLRAGQWLVLVALAALPWVALAVATDDRLGVARSVMAGAVAGFLAAVVVWPTLVASGIRARRWATLATGVVVAVLAALPWLVLGGPDVVDPDGFSAFAARADTPFGTSVSLLSGGGYFNSTIASPWRETWFVATLATGLAVISLVAVVGHLRSAGGDRPRALSALLATGGAGLVVAALGATGAGQRALVQLAELAPPLAAVRDTHRLLAPLVVVLAVGLGLAAGRLARHAHVAGTVAVAIGLLVLALPDPLVGPRLPGPTRMPDAWLEAAALVDADPRPGAVLVVPPGQTQRYAFTDGRPVAVPLRRLAAREVVAATSLRVGDLVVDDAPSSAPWSGLADRPPADWDADELADASVAWIAVTDPSLLPSALPEGLEVVRRSSTLVLVRVDEAIRDPVRTVPAWLVVLDLAWSAAVLVTWVVPWRGWTRRRRRARWSEEDLPVGSAGR